MKSIKLLAAAALVAFTAVPAAQAEDDGVLSPAAMEQLLLSNKLYALGEARKDALLMITAAQIRVNLDDTLALPGEVLTTSGILDAARGITEGQDDMVGLIEDVEAARGRGCSVRYGCQNPYIKY